MYTAFTVMVDVYAKIFWVADERMSGNGGGSQAGRVMRGKALDDSEARYARQGTRGPLCKA